MAVKRVPYRRCGAVAPALLVLLLLPAGALGASRSDGSTPAPAAILKEVGSVPTATLNAVGAGAFGNGISLRWLAGDVAPAGSRATLISENAAWCPHCAANSWSVAIALSRFGRLTGLRLIDSGTYYGRRLHASPSYPHTQGLSFLNARYTREQPRHLPAHRARRS